MSKSSDTAQARKDKDKALIAARNARNLDIVRWYLMIYPFGRKGLLLGLQREIERRKKSGEPPIEYFAPIYVEAKDTEGKIVRTEKQLFHNYVFVRSSVRELFNMKKHEEQYNFPRRESNSRGEHFYPYVSDEMMQNLMWIAQSYSGMIPVYNGDISWLVKGDRVKITSGPLKGVEALLFENEKRHRKEIMVVVDNWMTVPLLHVRESQYKVITLNGNRSAGEDIKIKDECILRLHSMMRHFYHHEVTSDDILYAKDVLAQYKNYEPASDVMRCKLYSLLLMAYVVLQLADEKERLIKVIQEMLPAIKAEQSKALLLTAVYGCTDNFLYHRQAHQIIDEWRKEDNPKNSKQILIQRLADYDKWFGHDGVL